MRIYWCKRLQPPTKSIYQGPLKSTLFLCYLVVASMINSLKKYQAWRSRSEQRSMERWERIRAGGQLRFVINTSLTFGLTIVGVSDVADWLSSSGPDAISLGNIIYYVLIGIPVSLVGWSTGESKYLQALHAARLPALSSGHHNSPLGITPGSKSTPP